ncbi:MAG: fatty acid desaturase CarF family protein [Bacteroidota bacterium]
MLTVILKSITTLATADFLTGLVHWWEDTYGNPNWKFLGKSIIEPNLIHHKKPRAFLQGNYWTRINTSFLAGLILLALCYLFHILNGYSFCCILLSIHGNEIHRLAHQSNKENGKFITALQLTGLLQSRKHHGRHHTMPYECSYCAITNYLNPLLDNIKFWNKLEWSILKLTGIKVLRGSPIRNGL